MKKKKLQYYSNRHSNRNRNSKKDLLRYAALGTQMLMSVGMAVFLGLKADQWLHTSPLFTCVLPLLVLGAIFFKLIQETK